MNRPEFLYHGSTNPNIQLLEPREEDPQYGKVISASQFKRIAAMFIAPKGFPTLVSRFGDEFVIVVQATQAEFETADKGGAIYTVSSDNFESDNEIGMQESEWRTTQPVKPLQVEVFTSATEAIRQTGAKLYFVDEAVFHKIKQADDYGWQIIQSLQPID